MNTVQITAQFSSIEEMAEKTGFALDFCQLEPGDPTLKTKTTILPSMLSTQFFFDKSFHQRGMAPDTYLTFGTAHRNSELTWSGKDAVANCLFDFNGRSGFDLRSEGLFFGTSIHVIPEKLHEISDGVGVDLPEFSGSEFSAPRNVDPAILKRFRTAVQNIEDHVSSLETLPEGKAGLLSAQDALYESLVDCLAISEQKALLSRSNRLKVRQRAVGFIHERYPDPISVPEICRASSTTSRTLERIFREEYGVTPTQYLKFVRLEAAKIALSRSDQEQSIRDIALSCGFWHLSQFAQDYKKQYGELPSTSLKQQHISSILIE